MPTRKPLLDPDAAAFVRGDTPAAPSPAITPPSAGDEARVRFTVDLPKSLHKRLKLAAMEGEKPMTDLARQALEEWLDSRG
jgi:hypothetical protein